MKFVPKAMFAAALTVGLAGAVVVTPAVAQKKKKGEEAAGPQLKLTESVRKSIAAAQAATDDATKMTNIAAAEAAAVSDDDKYVVAAMKLPIIAKGTDRAALVPLLDTLIVNPKTPAADLPRLTYFRGALAFENKKSAEALPYLVKARSLGYTSPDLALQIAQANVDSGNVPAGIAEIQTAIDAEKAAGRKAPEAWYSYAIGKLYTSGDRAATSTWMKAALAAYPTPQNWRKMIIIYRDSVAKGAAPLDRGQKLDLFRLMRVTQSLADQNDFLEYADLAFQAGLPTESMRVIDEGKTSGKIQATNTTATRIRADAATAAKAEGSLAALEKQAAASPNGKTAAGTGDAYLAQGQFDKAVPLYRLALQKGGVDASVVNLRLGQALAQSNQKAEAKTAFATVATGPGKDIAGLWTQWIDLAGAPAAAPAATN